MIEKLSKEWRAAGVSEGDVLLVHSSIRGTFKRCLKQGAKLSAVDILESFLQAVGPTGTLLLPLFNFEYTKGVPFDIRSTPSHMGALTEAGRLHPKAVRTGHPIYSFAVIGAAADQFKDIDNKCSYDDDSPFGLLRKMDGRVASLDLPDVDSMTFYHHVEEVKQVDYRFEKSFTADYTDVTGQAAKKSYSIYVRNLERGVLADMNPAGEMMWEEGLYQGCRPSEGSGLRTIRANAMFDFVANLIDSGQALGNLYRIDGDQNA